MSTESLQQHAKNSTAPIRSVAIIGGGTAGWMSAAALAKVIGPGIAIRLVESDDIGTVGVGESTIPMIRLFNKLLEIDEGAFMRETRATFKLGIEFCDWGRIGERYMHGFGRIGQDLATLPFYQYWLRMHQAGQAPDLGHFSINQMMARAGVFMRADPNAPNSPLADIVHAFHIDAGLYARFLRRYSEALGVVRTEGKVVDVTLRGADGAVESVRLASGEVIAADLFIDCTGFAALLIEQALHTGYEDWSAFLPCDRAWAVPCAASGEPPPFTRATARRAGWQWRIGLQHRTGNGHVYASAHMSDDEAASILMNNLDGEALADPKLLRFTSGRRNKVWNRNVVAIGLSAGFMEPLESTSIHLVQSAISRLLNFFPDQGFAQTDIDEFNRQSAFETERIRDFLVLHYHATTRSDSPFWDYCRTMQVPDTLVNKLDLYRSRGRIVRVDNELFSEPGWLQVMHGQGVASQGHHPLADALSAEEISAYLGDVAGVIERCVAQMGSHGAFVKRYCS
jgi:tryptophan halogenase